MPVDFCRHLAGKTLRNVRPCDSAYIRQVSDRMDIFLNKLIQFYFNNTTNLRHLTQRIMSGFTDKMAIVS